MRIYSIVGIDVAFTQKPLKLTSQMHHYCVPLTAIAIVNFLVFTFYWFFCFHTAFQNKITKGSTERLKIWKIQLYIHSVVSKLIVPTESNYCWGDKKEPHKQTDKKHKYHLKWGKSLSDPEAGCDITENMMSGIINIPVKSMKDI